MKSSRPSKTETQDSSVHWIFNCLPVKYILISLTLTFIIPFIPESAFAQTSLVKEVFPDKFYFEKQVLISSDYTVLEIENIQADKTYSVFMYDEREKSKRICDYSYGQDYKSTDEFVKVKAKKNILNIEIERFSCRFESSILVTVIVQCLDCDSISNGRDLNSKSTTDLKLEENSNYPELLDNLILPDQCFEVIGSSIQGTGIVGEFWQGEYSLGIDKGIALANAPLGSYQPTGGGNEYTNTGVSLGTAGDEDLTALLGYDTFDAASLEFDFIPNGNYLEFQYVFASEEWCEWVNSAFNDGFALLLSGPGIKGEDYGQPKLNEDALNLAVLPDENGALDYQSYVAIRTIHWNHYKYGHEGIVGNFYKSNNFLFTDPINFTGGHNAIGTCSPLEMMQSPLPSIPPAAPEENAFDAWTIPLKAKYNDLIPGETYHLKFVMADGSDRIWGSAVFVQAASFIGSNSIGSSCDDSNPNTINDVIDENCNCVGQRETNDCELWCPPIGAYVNVCSDCDKIIAAEDCADAQIASLCELDGFETSSCGLTVDGPGGLPGFCGPNTITHNNMWIGFTPDVSGRLHLHVEVMDCLSLNPFCNGIQCAVARALCKNPGNEFYGFEYETLACVNCVDQSFDLITNDAIAGVPHYIMVDGCCQEVCEIKITVIDGMQESEWSLESVGGTLCPDLLNQDCLSPSSTATVKAIPNFNADLGATLEFNWYDPSGNLIYSGPGIPMGFERHSTLFGINPMTSKPYFCEEGLYTVTVDDVSLCCAAATTIELLISTPLEAEVIFGDPNANVFNCDTENITLKGVHAVPEEDLVFENWYKVDWSSYPAEREIIPMEYGSNTGELNLNLGQDSAGAGTYIYTYIDSSSICWSETFVCIPADTLEPNVIISDALALDCSDNLTVTLNAAASIVNAVIMDCEIGDIQAGEYPMEEIVATDNYSVLWTSEDGHTILDANTLTPIVDKSGWYSCQITNNENGCLGEAEIFVEGSVDSPLVDPIPDVILNCTNNFSFEILAAHSNTTNAEYIWTNSNGETVGQATTLTVSDADVYALTVINVDNNCQVSTSFEVTKNEDTPSIDISDPAPITCAVSSSTIIATIDGSGDYSFSWLDKNDVEIAITQNYTATSAGEYLYIVMDNNSGCSSQLSVIVEVNGDLPIPDPMPELVLNCTNGGSVSQSASATDPTGINMLVYEWIHPDGTSFATGTNVTFTEAGLYSLIVLNPSNGCTATETINVVSDEDVPSINLEGSDELNCTNAQGISLIGYSDSGLDELAYNWTNATGVLSSESTLVVTAAGVYTLTVTNTKNGCTNTSSITVGQNIIEPTIVIDAEKTLSCFNDQFVILDASASFGEGDIEFAWFGPVSGSSETLQTSLPGLYTIVVTDQNNGCSSQSTVEVFEDLQAPQDINIIGGELTCSVSTVTLIGESSSLNVSYLWTDENNNIYQGSSIEVTSAGNYFLTVTNLDNGCTDQFSTEVNAATDIPSISFSYLNGQSTLTCSEPTVTIEGLSDPDNILNWYDENGNQISGNPLVIDEAGEYLLTATNPFNSCTAETTLNIQEDFESPILSTSIGVVNCEAGSIELFADDATGLSTTYTWMFPDGTSAMGANITISAPGNYIVIATSENSCTAEETVVINVDLAAPTISVSPDFTLTCANPTYELGGTSDPGMEYLWTGPAGFTSNEANPEIYEPGLYNLTVLNPETGCQSSSQVLITVDLMVDFIPSFPDDLHIDCEQESIALVGQANIGFVNTWIFPDGSVTNDVSIEASMAGIYTLEVENVDNGCVSPSQIVVTSDIFMPTATIDIVGLNSENILTCENNSISLSAESSFGQGSLTYNWVGPAGNSNNETWEISEAGTYTLIVTDDENSCTSEESIEILANQDLPIVGIPAEAILVCDANTVSISSEVSNVNGDYNYFWEGPAILTSNEESFIEVGSPGTYTVIVSDNSTACSTTQSFILAPWNAAVGDDMDICIEVEGSLMALTLPNIQGVFGNWQSSDIETVIADPFSPLTTFTCFNPGAQILIWNLYTDYCGSDPYSSDSLIVTASGLFPIVNDDKIRTVNSRNQTSFDILENDDLSAIENWSLEFMGVPFGWTINFNSLTGGVNVQAPLNFTGTQNISYVICNANCSACSTANIEIEVFASIEDQSIQSIDDYTINPLTENTPSKKDWNNDDKNEVLMSVYPNPFHDQFYIEFLLDKTSVVNINLYSSLGENVLSNEILLEKGVTKKKFNSIDGLDRGVYFISIQYENGYLYTQSVVKL